MASSDINPAFITSSPVDKATMRTQLQYVKDCIVALEALGGYRLLSSVVLAAPTTEIRVNLPTGYARYRVEFQDLRGVSNGTIQMRASINAGVTMISTADYVGIQHDIYGTSDVNSTFTDTSIALCQQSATEVGAFGHLDLVFQGARGEGSINFINTTPARGNRTMYFNVNASPVNHLQFYCQNFTIALQTGCIVQVLGR